MRKQAATWWWLSLVLCSLFGAQVVHAQGAEEQARAHFRLGRAHYSNGQFLNAAKEFERAYEISGRPALLYNLYLAYRDADDKPRAADALRRYLAEEEEVENRGQLEARLRILEKSLAEQEGGQEVPAPPDELASEPAAAAEQPPPAAEPSLALEAESAAAEPSEGGSKVLPLALMGVGGAMVVGSLVTGAMASSKQSDLEDACPSKTNCDPGLRDTEDSGKTLALVTDVLLFGGIAVAGAGVAVFLLDREGQESDAPTAALACVPGACGGSVRVPF